MCNYLNDHDNLNGWSLHYAYIFMKNVQTKMYSLFGWYIFKTVQQSKKGLNGLKTYSYQIYLYP